MYSIYIQEEKILEFSRCNKFLILEFHLLFSFLSFEGNKVFSKNNVDHTIHNNGYF